MYVPAAFREADLQVLHALIRANNFGTLVSLVDGELFATHLPFLLDAERGPFGTLIAHLARPNPHWHSFLNLNLKLNLKVDPDDGTPAGPPALAIFAGPHAYISPRWYAAELNVPTWNYTVVHAYGTPTIVQDAERVRDILDRTVGAHEPPAPDGWSIRQLPADYVSRMARGVVAFEMPISRIQGKSKLGQNRSADDVEGAAAGLLADGDDYAQQVARLMTEAVRR